MSTDESILFANNLIYDAPAASSVTTNRVLKRQQFQNIPKVRLPHAVLIPEPTL